MSLRYEQYWSLKKTKEFLTELLLKAKPRSEIKKRIRECLKHYPPLDERGKPFFSKDDLTEE